MQLYTEKTAVTFFVYLSILVWFANWGVQTLLSTRLHSYPYGDIFIIIELMSMMGTLCTYGLQDTVYNTVPLLQKKRRRELISLVTIITYSNNYSFLCN